jgi:hypothetical protein
MNMKETAMKKRNSAATAAAVTAGVGVVGGLVYLAKHKTSQMVQKARREGAEKRGYMTNMVLPEDYLFLSHNCTQIGNYFFPGRYGSSVPFPGLRWVNNPHFCVVEKDAKNSLKEPDNLHWAEKVVRDVNYTLADQKGMAWCGRGEKQMKSGVSCDIGEFLNSALEQQEKYIEFVQKKQKEILKSSLRTQNVDPDEHESPVTVNPDEHKSPVTVITAAVGYDRGSAERLGVQHLTLIFENLLGKGTFDNPTPTYCSLGVGADGLGPLQPMLALFGHGLPYNVTSPDMVMKSDKLCYVRVVDAFVATFKELRVAIDQVKKMQTRRTPSAAAAAFI